MRGMRRGLLIVGLLYAGLGANRAGATASVRPQSPILACSAPLPLAPYTDVNSDFGHDFARQMYGHISLLGAHNKPVWTQARPQVFIGTVRIPGLQMGDRSPAPLLYPQHQAVVQIFVPTGQNVGVLLRARVHIAPGTRTITEGPSGEQQTISIPWDHFCYAGPVRTQPSNYTGPPFPRVETIRIDGYTSDVPGHDRWDLWVRGRHYRFIEASDDQYCANIYARYCAG